MSIEKNMKEDYRFETYCILKDIIEYIRIIKTSDEAIEVSKTIYIYAQKYHIPLQELKEINCKTPQEISIFFVFKIEGLNTKLDSCVDNGRIRRMI